MIGSKSNLLNSGFHLFALFGFAVALPLFDLLVRHAGFLVAHRATPMEITLLVLILVVLLPAVAWVLELVAWLLTPRLQQGLHLLLVGLLVAITALPGLKHIPQLSGTALVLLGVLLGTTAAVAYVRLQTFRSFMTVLALAPLLSIGFFVLSRPISKLLFAEQEQQAILSKVDAKVPVVMVIFDELPLTSLMDEQRQIDAVRYPAFAALAQNSTWFRNTNTVHNQTYWAIPAILTGRYPTDRSLFPIAPDYPLNLFTLLQKNYEMRVLETQTMLHPQTASRGDRRLSDSLRDMRILVSDLYLVYLHMILPEELARDLPSVQETWGNFRHAGGHKQNGGSGTQPQLFTDFVESITPCEGPCLYFMHTMLPHQPWRYLPSGKQYFPHRLFGANPGMGKWGDEEWWVIQGYQRHLLQVALTDRLLGKLLSRLKAIDMYNRSLVIVTADHGISFWPNQPRRGLVNNQHPEDVMGVPLLVKAPYQQIGKISDRNVQTIDILPTVTDILGVYIPWSIDGCSALALNCPERRGKVAIDSWDKFDKQPRSPNDGLPHFDPDVLFREDSLKRKLALFGSAPEPNSLFTIGVYSHLVGRKVNEIGIKGVMRASVSLGPNYPSDAQQDDEAFTPVFITGSFHSREDSDRTLYLAIAASGTVHAVAPILLDSDGRSIFSAMVPEEAVQGGRGDFHFFVVEGPREEPDFYQISHQ